MHILIATGFGTGIFIAYLADAHETGNWRFQTYKTKKALENTFTVCKHTT